MGKEFDQDEPVDTGFVLVEPENSGGTENTDSETEVKDETVSEQSETENSRRDAEASAAKGGSKGKAGKEPGTKKKKSSGTAKQPKQPKQPNQSAGKVFGNIGKGVAAGLVVLAAAGLVQSSIYSIKETESVVLTTFGKASVEEEKGLHFKIPFIQQATRVDTTVKGLKIGYKENSDGTSTAIEHESVMITSDYNFIDCDFYISYQVTDPVKYLYQSDEPDLIVKNIAMSSIRSTVSAYTVDTAITTGKAEIQSNVKSMIVAELEEKDIGITLIDASIQDVEPPTDEIIEAFTAVETAKQGKESSINQANAYRNEQIPAAEAEADRILQEAEAKKTARINEAKGQAARFEEEYNEYKNYPLITKQRMFMETMEEVLPTLKVVIDNGDGSVNKYYPITDLGTISAEEAAAVSGAGEQ